MQIESSNSEIANHSKHKDGRNNERTEKLTESYLRQEYINNKRSILSISKELEVLPETVRRRLEKFKITIRSAKETNSKEFPCELDKTGLNKLYVEDRLSPQQIAELYSLKTSQVRYLLSKHKISMRSAAQGVRLNAGKDIEISLTAEQLYQLYVIEKVSITQIANRYGSIRRTIRNKLKSLGIPRRSVKEASTLANGNHHLRKVSKSMWQDLYIEKKHDCEFLGRVFGVCAHAVRARLREHNITLRNKSEAIRIIKQNPGIKALTPEFLNENYVIAGSSCYRIGRMLNIAPSSVRNYLILYGFPVRSLREAKALEAPGSGNVNVYFALPLIPDKQDGSKEIIYADENAIQPWEGAAKDEEAKALGSAMEKLRSHNPISYFLLKDLFGIDAPPKSKEQLEAENNLDSTTVELEINKGLKFLKQMLEDLHN